jgi:putative addiction module killer protein
MIEVRQTAAFADWFKSLKDKKTLATIAKRVVRLQSGLLGDVKPVGSGVSELRIDYGPGFRLYFAQKGKTLVVLLCGGDKSTQTADIKRAKELAAGLQQAS